MPMGRHNNTHHPGRWATIGVLIIATTAVTACADDDSDHAAELNGATEQAAATIAPSESDTITTEQPAPADETVGSAPTGVDFGDIGRDVIVELHVFMTSDDIARSVASITSDAASLRGGVASSDVDYGSGDSAAPSGHAVLVVRVPPDKVNHLVDGLDTTGTVVSLNQIAEDVTDQLVDLDVRIANARASVANVREFMEQTTDLSQLVTLEGELSRRQTALEQLEAQQHNLGDRVQLATVTVEIAPTPAVPETGPAEQHDGLGDGLQSGWEAFVAIVFAIVYVLAVLAPFLVVGLVAAGIAWMVIRRRPRHAAPTTAQTAPQPVQPVVSEEPDRESATPVG